MIVFIQRKITFSRLEMSNTFPSAGTAKTQSIFSFLTKNDNVQHQLTFPLVVAANLQNAFPEVKSITRFADEGDNIILANNQAYKEQHVLFADSNFFNNFSFHLLKGNPKTVLNSTGNIVISASLAKKYFGNKNPVGKTIQVIVDTTKTFIISGVAEDAPHNSSIQYSVVMPLLSYVNYQSNINGGLAQQIIYTLSNWQIMLITKSLRKR